MCEKEEIEALVDGYTCNDKKPEIFFNRNWQSFDAILHFHRTGSLHFEEEMCALVFKNDLDFWGIDELLMEPCCALKYYPFIELCVSEMEGQIKAKAKQEQREIDENFGDHVIGKIRKSLWNLTEYPETSKAAQIGAFTSLGLVIISTFTFVISTFPGI